MDFIQGLSYQDLGALTAGSLGVIGVAIWWFIEHKVLKESDKVDKAVDDAQYDVITLLRQEVLRMAESNKALGIGLAQFQAENIELRLEIANLHEIIGELSARIDTLTRAAIYCKNCNGLLSK